MKRLPEKGKNKSVRNARENVKTAKSSLNASSDHCIYEWVKALESKCLGSNLTKPAREGTGHLQLGFTPGAASSRPSGITQTHSRNSSSNVMGWINQRNQKLHEKEAEEENMVADMFQAAHTFILDRQRTVAADMLLWRDEIVGEWKQELDLRGRGMGMEISEQDFLTDGKGLLQGGFGSTRYK
jgi:hypothetical protein